jgi:hypothetical protein
MKMICSKRKMIIAVGVALILVAATTTVIVEKIKTPNFETLAANGNFWVTKQITSSDPQMTREMYHDSTQMPVPPSKYVIGGTLNECMMATDTCYFVDTDVSAGTVLFGHTEPLKAAQWVVAFESALQTGTPEWWDSKQKRFRKGNLVLIRYPKQKIVLVLPKEKAAKYQ